MKFEFSGNARNEMRKMLQKEAAAYNFFCSQCQYDAATEARVRLDGMLLAVGLILGGSPNQAAAFFTPDHTQIECIVYRVDSHKSIELRVQQYERGLEAGA